MRSDTAGRSVPDVTRAVNPAAWLPPLVPVTLAVAAAAPIRAEAPAREPAPPRAQVSTDCAWSFFADPRALAHGHSVLTACVTSRGRPVLVRAREETGRRTVVPLFARLEADDHNNPGIVFWHGRLWAFSSPHSGHMFPLNRHMLPLCGL